MKHNLTAEEALTKLREGNQRYVEGNSSLHRSLTRARESLAAGQQPFAILLGCSDSRVPSELVFDRGLGDLFVIRVAGNIVAPSQVGSVEFAAASFGSPLVVVMGHSNCGAVAATIAELRQEPGLRSPNLAAIVDRVRPAIEPLLADDHADEKVLMRAAVRANIDASVRRLRSGSEILDKLCLRGTLVIMGAEYDLETGQVSFYES